MLTTTSNPTAKISLKKNLLKVYKVGSEDVVYLPKDAEFEIELFNPTTEEVAAEILINNKTISTQKLIVRPGERVFLERYLDSAVKFKFDTYIVEDTKESTNATKDNGLITVRFYKKMTYPVYDVCTPRTWISQPTWTTSGSGVIYTANSSSGISCKGLSAEPVTCYAATLDAVPVVETGRIAKGGDSDQVFGTSYDDFNPYWFHYITVRILPASREPITADSLKVRQYCSECGSKVKATDKFCSNCGTKL